MPTKTRTRTRKRKISDNNNNNNNNNVNRSARRAILAPSSIGSYIRPPTYSMTSSNGGQEVRVHGRDVLGSLSGSSSSSNIAGVFDMNPACWHQSRLSLIAKTYEKYRFNSFTLHYLPSVGTTSSGLAAAYYEPEIYDNVFNSVAGSLTQFNSAAGPCWSPLAVKVTTAPTDKAVYLCTEKTGIERQLLSQGKAVFLTENNTLAAGIAYIEYDVTFMYPELEVAYAGEQYTRASMTVTAAANGIIATVPSPVLTGVKLLEIVLEQSLTQLFVTAASNFYDYAVGSLLYSAWDGTSWRLYPDIASALAKNGPLSSVNAIAGIPYEYLIRKLVAPPI